MAGADTRALISSLGGTAAFTVRDGSWNFMIEQTGKMDLTEKEAALPQNQRTHFDIGNATLTRQGTGFSPTRTWKSAGCCWTAAGTEISAFRTTPST